MTRVEYISTSELYKYDFIKFWHSTWIFFTSLALHSFIKWWQIYWTIEFWPKYLFMQKRENIAKFLYLILIQGIVTTIEITWCHISKNTKLTNFHHIQNLQYADNVRRHVRSHVRMLAHMQIDLHVQYIARASCCYFKVDRTCKKTFFTAIYIIF